MSESLHVVGFAARGLVRALDTGEVERRGTVEELLAAVEAGRFLEHVDAMLGLENAPMFASEPPDLDSVRSINAEVARRYALRGRRLADARNDPALVALGLLAHLVWLPGHPV